MSDELPVTSAAVRDSAVMAQVHVRWDVKTGGDKDASKINKDQATATTIQHLAGVKPPAAWPPPNRLAPEETTLWRLDATLTGYKHESDGDYHLVLSDGNNTMVVEIPDPAQLDPKSLFKEQILAARSAFEAKYGKQLAALDAMPQQADASAPMIVQVSEPVSVTGIGFFDFSHGATGAAPNCIELHPILSIAFKA